MTWSFSRVHCVENCNYEFYLNYLLFDKDGNRIYDNEQNFYAAFGKFCHDLLEAILKRKLSIDEAYIKYQEEYDKRMDKFNIREATNEKYFYLGLDYFGDLDFNWLDKYEVLGIEKKVHFKVGKYSFVGYIDLLLKDKETGEIIVIDHKSSEFPLGKKGKVLKRKQEAYLSYKRQLYLYSKAIIEEYVVPPSKIKWNYFREKQWLELPFIQEEYEEALDWAEKTIEKIINEEEFPARVDYFYCHNLCGFRNSCEYKSMGGEVA